MEPLPTRRDAHVWTPSIETRRAYSPWSLLVAIASVLAVLVALLAPRAQADTIWPNAGGANRTIVGDHPVTSGARIISSSLITPASHPSVIYEIDICLSENSGGTAVLVHEINTGASESSPNGTATVDCQLNSGTALELGKEYTFAVAAGRLDQEGNLISHNFSLTGTTPRIRYLDIRQRRVP